MTRIRTLLATTLVGAGLTLAAGLPASAQDAVYLQDDAGRCDIFRTLSRIVPADCAQPGDHALVRTRGLGKTRGLAPSSGTIRTRGIRIYDQGEVSPAAAPEPAFESSSEVAAVEQSAPPEKLAFAMRVQFAYDSFELTGEARAQLDRIAEVLTDELMRDVVVNIEGHADAHGPDAYNLTLSQLRARAVRAYLIRQHGVDPDRLPFVGKGEREPFDPSDPYNGINRRVEFENLTG